MKKYKCLLFDLDRTLWDVEKNQKEALHQLYAEHRLDRFEPDFERCFGIYAAHNDRLWIGYRDGEVTREELRHSRFRYMLRDLHVDDEPLALTLSDEYIRLAPTFRHMIPYATEVVSYLSARYPLYIVTNGFQEVQQIKLKNCGLSGYFREIICSEAAGATKPRKEIFDYALLCTGFSAEEVLMIGDDYMTDIVGAVNAGIDSVFFNPGKAPCNQDPASTYEIQSLPELITFL